MKRYLICLLLPLFSVSIEAHPIYQIEMIIFSHISASTLNSEKWPSIPAPKLDLSKAWGLTPSEKNVTQSKQAKTYTLLPTYDFQLKEAAEKLSKDPRYKVILHVAWRQPLTSKHQSKWVHIYGGKGYDANGNLTLSSIDGATPYADAQSWQVDGLVRFDVKHYINSSYNLFLGVPTDEVRNLDSSDQFNDSDSPLYFFNLHQKRRMKSNELNYIGHPLYGVLVYAKKITH